MDIAKELGAVEAVWTQKLSLYVPDKDKDGAEIPDYERWVKAAREVLSRIGRGSMALPPGDGTWEKEAGEILSALSDKTLALASGMDEPV